MPVNRDFRDLLSALNDAGVRYVIVGGYAFAYHAHPRFTKDLDVFVEPTKENARRVHDALAAFGAPVRDLAVSDLETAGLVFHMGFAPNRIDVMTAIDGVTFTEAWMGRVSSRYGDQDMHILGRSELMRNKRASGRPQDLVDLAALESED